jgi:CheY-like chemotaxis protein
MNRKKDSHNLVEEMRLAEACPFAAQTAHGPESPDPAGDRDDNLSYGTETILLVDDEKVIIDVARDMLEFLGYQVIVALSGREAIDIYAQKKDQIDLVIQDMVMPVIDGAAVFAALKQMNPYVKVILASGYVYNEKISTVMEQGCRAFMPKPFRLEDLSYKVRKVLDSP